MCCAACLVQHFRKKGWVEVAGVKQQLPTASMDAMREVLGAHSDAKGLAAFNSATNGLYHPNALPRGPDSENAAQRPASAQFKAADPGHASPLTMHTGLTIASRHLGRANPIVPPKPERVECVESLLSQARGVFIPCADFSVTNSSQVRSVNLCLLLVSGRGTFEDWATVAAIRLSLGTVLHGWYGSRHYRTRQLTVHSNRQRALQEMVHVISQCESDIIVVGAGYTGKRKHRKGTRVIPGLKYLVRYLSLHRRLVLFNEYLTRWAAAGNSKCVVLEHVCSHCYTLLYAAIRCCLQQTVCAVPSLDARPERRLRAVQGSSGTLPPLRPHRSSGPAGGDQHPQRCAGVRRDR